MCHKPNHIQYDFAGLPIGRFSVPPHSPQIRCLGRISFPWYVPRLYIIRRDTGRLPATHALIFSQAHRLAEFLPGEALVFVEGMAVDVQRGAGLGVAQKARHRAHIHALGDQHTGICVPQAVHVQVVRQAVLPQDLLEAEGEGAGHHRVAIGLPKQVIVLGQFPAAPLLRLPLALLFPGAQQLAHFFGEIHHPHPRPGLGFLDHNGLPAQFDHVSADVQRPLPPVDVRPAQASPRRIPVARMRACSTLHISCFGFPTPR